MSPPFRAFPQFNDPARAGIAGMRARLDPNLARLFTGPSLLERLARAFAARRVLPVKELVESAEFFDRVRRRVRGRVLADLCCGHGLVGILFAVQERSVERVVLVDRRRPKSFDTLLGALEEVAPWAVPKLDYVEAKVRPDLPGLDGCEGIVAVHACGARTDRAMEVAIARTARFAAMPCCYNHTADRVPPALRESLGACLATDVDRTYRLEAARYRVAWSAVPSAITPHNRILVAEPRAEGERRG